MSPALTATRGLGKPPKGSRPAEAPGYTPTLAPYKERAQCPSVSEQGACSFSSLPTCFGSGHSKALPEKRKKELTISLFLKSVSLTLFWA